MNLTSCTQCGVVLDRDNLIFPDVYDPSSYEMNMENVEWNENLGNHVAVVPCPVCGNNIRQR